MRAVPFIGWSGTCALQPLFGVFDSLLVCSRLFLSQSVENVLVFAQFSAQANNRPRSHNLGLWNAAVQQISTVGFDLGPWCGCPETTQTKSESIQSCIEMSLGMAKKNWNRFSKLARFMFHLLWIWINDGRTIVYGSPKQPHISEKRIPVLYVHSVYFVCKWQRSTEVSKRFKKRPPDLPAAYPFSLRSYYGAINCEPLFYDYDPRYIALLALATTH